MTQIVLDRGRVHDAQLLPGHGSADAHALRVIVGVIGKDPLKLCRVHDRDRAVVVYVAEQIGAGSVCRRL